MADKDVVAEIRRRRDGWAQGLLDAYGAVLCASSNYGEEPERDASIAGLTYLVGELREVAELYGKAKMRGAKGEADELNAAARVIEALAAKLRKLDEGAPPAPRGGPSVPAEWCGDAADHGPHTWRMVVDVVDRGGATLSAEPGPMRQCLGRHERDSTGLRALVEDRAGVKVIIAPAESGTFKLSEPITGPATVAIGVVSAGAEAYLRGATNDIPGSPPLGPGSVTTAATRAFESSIVTANAAAAKQEKSSVSDPFDDPYPVTHTVLGMGQHGCSGLPVLPSDWSSSSTTAEGFRVPLGAAAGGDLFDDPAPIRRQVRGTVVSWSDLRGLIGKDRRGAGLPEHLSHSQIATLGECGLKYLAQRDELLGVEEVPQWALIGGNAFHAAVEWFERVVAEVRTVQHVRDRLQVFRDEHGGRAQTPAEALWLWAFGQQITDTALTSAVPQDDWRASNKGLEGYTFWLINGGDYVQGYLDARLAELGGSGWRAIRQVERVEAGGILYEPMIEHEFRLDVEGTPFVGFIDQVWDVTEQYGEMRPGDILIDDCKSGARVGADTRQLGEYALWLDREQPAPEVSGFARRRRIWGRFYDARKRTWSEPVDLLARHPWDELVVEVLDADAKKAAGLFAPHRTNFCGGCSVKHACPIFATAAVGSLGSA